MIKLWKALKQPGWLQSVAFAVCIVLILPSIVSWQKHHDSSRRINNALNAASQVYDSSLRDPGTSYTTAPPPADALSASPLLWFWYRDLDGKASRTSRPPGSATAVTVHPSFDAHRQVMGTTFPLGPPRKLDRPFEAMDVADALLAPLAGSFGRFEPCERTIQRQLAFDAMEPIRWAVVELEARYGPITYYRAFGGKRVEVEFTYEGSRVRFSRWHKGYQYTFDPEPVTLPDERTFKPLRWFQLTEETFDHYIDPRIEPAP